MRTAIVIIFWLSLLAGYILWACRKAGVTWEDFVRGLQYNFRIGPCTPNYCNPGWSLGEMVGFFGWIMAWIAAVAVFLVVFVASFIWAGVI